MECDLIKIYEYFVNLKFPKPELNKIIDSNYDPIIAKHSRYIGSAFDSLIKNQILLIHGDKSYDTPFFSIYSKIKSDEIIVNKIYCNESKFNSKYRRLKNEKQLHELDYSELFTSSVEDIEERNKCAEHVKKLISKFRFEHFIPDNQLVSNFTPEIHMDGVRKYRVAILEIIKDNEIIEIKSDIKFEGIKPEYIAQLCFYYFVIKWLRKYDIELKDSIIKNINPSNLCIYYVYHNYRYQFDPSILFNDQDVITDLISKEILEGNNLIQDVISLAISSKKNETKRKKLFSKIEKRKMQIYLDLAEKHLYNNEGEIARELLNQFSYKLEASQYIKLDRTEFLEISENHELVEDKIRIWELQTPIRAFKKTIFNLAKNSDSKVSYLTMIKSFLPLIEGSEYTYGFSFRDQRGFQKLKIKSFELKFSYLNNYSPIKIKHFEVQDSDILEYSIDFSMCYFFEDCNFFYALSGPFNINSLKNETNVHDFQIPVLNIIPFRSLPKINSRFTLSSNLFGERIWRFVGYENLKIENIEYKKCAKFIIEDDIAETTKIWLKKGVGLVQKEYSTGRVEWLIDYNIPNSNHFLYD
jgi:hypothetical protein